MTTDTDVLILGAGFTGLYSMYKFRDEMGLRVMGFDPAEGPGGVWHWNRYPGARCDFPSVYYSFRFSREVASEWKWSEKYAAQPEIEAYMNFVADRLDLRRSFEFGVGATSVAWDDAASCWRAQMTDGREISARFLMAGTGPLSVPADVKFPGQEKFAGQFVATSSYPKDLTEFSGKRVGVIGTGSSGIQVIQEAAKTADHLTVFQRTPQFATPMRNKKFSADEQTWNVEHLDEIYAIGATHPAGADFGPMRPSLLAEDPAEVRKHLAYRYELGGMGFAFGNYADVLYDPRANEVISEFVREQIRARVNDPKTAEMLCPKDYPYTTKRPPLETNYFEVYNQPNVDLIDIKATPIVEFTEKGIRTTDGEVELDVIIVATGFDAFTGAQLALPMTGRNGATLQKYWDDGPLAYMGMFIHDFPNYFQIGVGPSAGSQRNAVWLTEEQIDFAAAAVAEVIKRDATTIEPTSQADQDWKTLCDGILPYTLYPLNKNTWFLGHNVEGKKPVAYAFFAGAPLYLTIAGAIAHGGWGGFAIDGVEQGPTPSLVRLEPGVANFVGGMMNAGAPTLEEAPLEVIRGMVAGSGDMQLPGPDMAVTNVEDARVRVYAPESDSPLPVIIALHGGGFVAGTLDTFDPTCRRLAHDVGAVVVNVDYRLAPEHPYPAALHDVRDAVTWVRENIASFGGDPSRIAFVGESAGANLATVVARWLGADGNGVAAQVLLYPTTHGTIDSGSKREFFHGPFVSTPTTVKFWNMYVGDGPVTPDNSPLTATDLDKSAPALVITMGVDPLRDEGELYAQALTDAGVDAELQRFEGLMHGTYTFSKVIPAAQAIHERVVEYLRRVLG